METILKSKGHFNFKQRVRQGVAGFKELQGEPQYIARGMALGVFISITPTIPLHTIIALALAFIFKASKPAAAIGVWLCNPLTMPFFYIASYKTGVFLLGTAVPLNQELNSITALLDMGLDVTVAMVAGGLIVGLIPGVAAYFITLKLVRMVRRTGHRQGPGDSAPNESPSQGK